MNLERILQITLASMVALGGIMMGVSERAWIQPSVCTLLVIASVVWNEMRGQITVSNFYANLLAMLALAFSISQMRTIAGDEVLIAMSDLLVFLQIILLFKRKQLRDYGLILVANLLQVSVAAALNLFVSFAFLLLAHMAFVVTALCLFMRLREERTCGTRVSFVPRGEPKSSREWPLSQARSYLAATPRLDHQQRVERELWWLLGGATLKTLLLTTLVFLALPRISDATLKSRLMTAGHLVGFTEQVTLGELGKISEDSEYVMSVKLTDVKTNTPITLVDEPLWHGTTLVSYQDGQWSRSRVGSSRRPRFVTTNALRGASVRENIEIGPLDSKVLFSLAPSAICRDKENVVYRSDYDQLERLGSRNDSITYELYTAVVRNRIQQTLVPHEGPLSPAERAEMLQLPELVDGVDPLAQLKTLAQQAVASVPADDRIRIARTLESLLGESGRFSYSLSAPTRGANTDPIEDFVTANPVGHCEYFASALALMLRSVGIPSRVVVGFKGGNIDPISQAYQVQQLHAHSWVEAYLNETDVPNEIKATDLWSFSTTSQGGWLRLDPTPAINVDGRGGVSWFVLSYRQVIDYTRAIWSNYVIGLDAERQREVFFQPIKNAWEALIQPATWQNLGQRMWSSLRNAIGDVTNHEQSIWRSLVFLASSAIVAIALGAALVRRLRGARWGWLRRRRRAGPARVPFYETLERLLARQGLVRSAGQTPREFAFAVGGELAERLETQAVAGVPRRIAEMFYRVRYGGRTLNANEQQAVDLELQRLAQALGAARRKPR